MTNKETMVAGAKLAADAAATIRAQNEKIAELETKLAAHTRDQHIAKVASAMRSKGLVPVDVPNEAVTEHLAKMAANGKLETLEQAVEMTGVDLWSKTAQLAEGQRDGSSSRQDFENFLMRANKES